MNRMAAFVTVAGVATGLAIGLTFQAPLISQARETAVAPVVARQAQDFDLKDVRLLDGPFKQAVLRDQQYLLALDQDRLLHNFRLTAGLPSTAAPLADGRHRTLNCAATASATISRRSR